MILKETENIGILREVLESTEVHGFLVGFMVLYCKLSVSLDSENVRIMFVGSNVTDMALRRSLVFDAKCRNLAGSIASQTVLLASPTEPTRPA